LLYRDGFCPAGKEAVRSVEIFGQFLSLDFRNAVQFTDMHRHYSKQINTVIMAVMVKQVEAFVTIVVLGGVVYFNKRKKCGFCTY
jgi:hypothetical protein